MKLTLGLVSIATGMSGQQIYSLVYAPSGEVAKQMVHEDNEYELLSIKGFETIKEVTSGPDWQHIGYAIGNETSPAELTRFLNWIDEVHGKLATALEEEYLPTELARSVREHPLFKVMEARLYRI